MSMQPAEIDRPETSGRVSLTLVPGFTPQDPRSRISRSPGGAPGPYSITLVLAIPGFSQYQADLTLERLMRSGDSLLQMAQQYQVSVAADDGSYTFCVLLSPNERGAFATAEAQVQAESFPDAEKTAHDLIAPILSWWSYNFDVALDVSGVKIVEDQTGSFQMSFSVLGKERAFDPAALPPRFASSPQFRPILSADREGLNASNSFYRFLSFYKVVEGIRRLRAQRRQATLSANTPYREPEEKMPDDPASVPGSDEYAESTFTPYLGRKFTWVTDQLRELVRNAVAHLDPTADTLVLDSYADMQRCELAIPLVKYIARMMVANEVSRTAP